MFLGKVVGTVWSTKKTPDLEGVKFLIVHPIDLDKEPTRNVVVVADISQARESAAALKDRFRGQGERLGVRVYAQREDLFNAMHRI